MNRPIHHQTAQRALENAIYDLLILQGANIGPSGSSWQDIAGTAAVNLRCVAAFLDQARQGGAQQVKNINPVASTETRDSRHYGHLEIVRRGLVRVVGPNQTELWLKNGTIILFSYETPVAAKVIKNPFPEGARWSPEYKVIRTKTKHSKTTSKHINAWLDGHEAVEVDQEILDSLI